MEVLVVRDGTVEVTDETDEVAGEAEEKVGVRFHVTGFEVVSTALTSKTAVEQLTQYLLWSLEYTIYQPR